MKKNHQENSASEGMVLIQDVVRFGGMQLLYALSVKKSVPNNHFEVSVCMDGETAVADAGEDIDLAMEHYRRVVAGIVTPCTLEDVTSDFEYSCTKLRKKLYKRAFM